MAKFASPTLKLVIDRDQWAESMSESSGGCLVADAIKKQYPHLSGVSVDMATIRVTDRAKGERYVYLTPATAQHLVLAFDQGWPQPTQEVTIRRAVKITPIKRNRAAAEQRRARLAELEAKEERGEELTPGEKRSLIAMRKNPERPTTEGPSEVGGPPSKPVIRGGGSMPRPPANPNLLRGRNRVYGAQTAQPGQAFADAVDVAVAQRLAKEQAVAELPDNIV